MTGRNRQVPLLSMALSLSDLRGLVGEIRRVLRPGGLLVYTALHTADGEYATGVRRGDGLYEYDGLAVRFFARSLVEELSSGWLLDDVHELADVRPHRPLWRVTQAKPG